MKTKKPKAIKLSQEEIESNSIQSSIKDIRLQYNYNETIPTIKFDVGEKVQIGNLHSTIINEVIDDGKCYVVDYNRDGLKKYKSCWYWTDIQKFRTVEEINLIPKLHVESDYHLNYSQMPISSIFSKHYNFGIVNDPDYQRGNVWELSDKENLIHSIFNDIDIGKFVFISLEWDDREDHKSYEVLDGKQRINALIEFYENRFSYNGHFYKDLHPRDVNHFKNYPASIATINKITQKQKYEYFLKLNVAGKAVDKDHLDYVKSLLEN